MGSGYPEYCAVIEWPEGLKVDECVWDPPCQEHQRRDRLKAAQADATTTQDAATRAPKRRSRNAR